MYKALVLYALWKLGSEASYWSWLFLPNLDLPVIPSEKAAASIVLTYSHPSAQKYSSGRFRASVESPTPYLSMTPMPNPLDTHISPLAPSRAQSPI